MLEPEIAVAEHEDAPPPPGEGPRTRSYISDHPTNFDWRQDVARLVNRIQKHFPNQTLHRPRASIDMIGTKTCSPPETDRRSRGSGSVDPFVCRQPPATWW